MKNLGYTVNITVTSYITMTHREVEQLREYFEDMGCHNICITETGQDSNGVVKTTRLVEPPPAKVNLAS